MDCLTRLRRRHGAQRAHEADGSPRQAFVGDIDFTAFTATSRISGRLALVADRLSDALNDATNGLVIDAATVVELDSLETHTSERLLVSRDDLLIVRGAGPVGSPGRRQRTLVSGVELTLGPYRVTGLIHAGPGVNPISGIYHRRTMIPLTGAVVSYLVAGRSFEEPAATLIIHRDRITSIRLTEDVMALRSERPIVSGAG